MALDVLLALAIAFCCSLFARQLVARIRLRNVPLREQIRRDNLRELTNPRLFTR